MLLKILLSMSFCLLDSSSLSRGPCDGAPPADAPDGAIRAYCVAQTDDGSPADAKVVNVKAIAVAGSPDADGKPCVIVRAMPADGASDGDDVRKIVVMCDDKTAVGGAPQHVVVTKRMGAAGADLEPGGPWLGIQFGPVTKPLAAHLQLEKGVGQLVLNVTVGSPADQAGVQQYDVIVRLDGEDVSADVGEFVERVKELEIGRRYGLTIMRGGKEMETSLTVAARPDNAGELEYKYEGAVEELARDQIFRRGGILHKDGQGNWIFDNMGELEDLKNLPFDLKLPGGEGLDSLFQWTEDLPGLGSMTTIQIFVENDQSVEVRRQDGKITVTRTTTENGQKTSTTKVYDSEDEFAKDDPKAFELSQQKPSSRFGIYSSKQCPAFGGTGSRMFEFLPGELDIKLNLQDAIKNAEEARTKAAEAMKDAQGAWKDAQESYQTKIAEMARKQDWHEGALGDYFYVSKARTTFEVGEDGSISVITRKGGEELKETFKNADALKHGRPDLYKKYARLQKSEQAAD